MSCLTSREPNGADQYFGEADTLLRRLPSMMERTRARETPRIDVSVERREATAMLRRSIKRAAECSMSEYRERAKSLQDAIRQVLLHDWDPIGVADVPEAQDEYDSYISQIYGMLIRQGVSPALVRKPLASGLRSDQLRRRTSAKR